MPPNPSTGANITHTAFSRPSWFGPQQLVLAASALAGVSSAGQVMTSLSFQGSGFPDGVFKAHLHASTCANDGGGVSREAPGLEDGRA